MRRHRSIDRAFAKIGATLRLQARGQAIGDVLLFPALEQNVLYVKRCGTRHNCFRVATHVSSAACYHRPGTRYACELHRRAEDVEITDAMLRGAIRGHHCHATADCTGEPSPYRVEAA